MRARAALSFCSGGTTQKHHETGSMKKLLLALFCLLLTLNANAWEELPKDDPALQVLDRDLVTVYKDEKEVYFYGVLSNTNDQTYLDVYQGLPWKRVYRWPVTFEGNKVKVRDRAVLHISNDEEGETLYFYWNDFVGYAEAAVRQSLVYDRRTGKFTTTWSD